jgi:hypothetical protein
MIVRAVTVPPAAAAKVRRTSGFVKVLPPPAPLPTRRALSSVPPYALPPRRDRSEPSVEVEISLADAEESTAAHHAPRAPVTATTERDTLPAVIVPPAPRPPSPGLSVTTPSNVIRLPLPPRPPEHLPPANQNQVSPALSPALAGVAVRSAELEADRAMFRAEAMLIVREAVARIEAAKQPQPDAGAGLRWLVAGILTGIFGAYVALTMATRSARVDAHEVARAVLAQQAQQIAQAPAANAAPLAQPPAPQTAVGQLPLAQAAPTSALPPPAPLPAIPHVDVESLPKHPAAPKVVFRPVVKKKPSPPSEADGAQANVAPPDLEAQQLAELSPSAR